MARGVRAEVGRYVAILFAGLLAVAVPLALSRYRQWFCEVHGELLETGDVPVVYGREAGGRIPWYVSGRQFPNARLFVDGDGVTGPDRQLRTRARFCRACRLAREVWILEHLWPTHAGLPSAPYTACGRVDQPSSTSW